MSAYRFGLIVIGLCAAFASDAAAQVTAIVKAVPLTEAEQEAFVEAHNAAREAVDVPPLEWSDDLAKFGAEWLEVKSAALKMQAEMGQFPNPGHRPPTGEHQQRYGENLAMWGGTADFIQSDPKQAVDGWMKEKAAYDKLNAAKPYVTGDELGKTDAAGKPIVVGHYTQLIWRDTKQVGAARVEVVVSDGTGAAQKKYVVVVANYDPPGNIIGRKPK